MMVTFKVDADARATVQGSEDQEKHPIVAKVKGTGKDGALSVEVAPITVIPNLESAAKNIDFSSLIGAITKLSQGVSVQVANSGVPLSIALGKIPVDLTISVSSPSQEAIFKVEIKGTVGE